MTAVEEWIATKSRDKRGRRRKPPTLNQLVTTPDGLAALSADKVAVERTGDLLTKSERARAQLWPYLSADYTGTEGGLSIQRAAPAPVEREPVNEVFAVALRHAAHGRPVLPVDPATKRPLTEHGFLDASTDPDTIRGWFDVADPPMVAIRTGEPSRLIVVDADGEEGAETLHELEQRHGALPRTASVVTPRPGQHYYLDWPGVEVPCSAGRLGPGVDVRGDGGYAIVPPSQRSDGKRYEIDEETPAAPMPRWLVELACRTASASSAPAPVGEWLRILGGVGEGERNTAVARISGHLLRHYIDVDLVLAIAHLVNERFSPPLAGREVLRTVESIAARELRRREAER